jgi:hypothetical protein
VFTQTIWQRKVPADAQGRVFGLRAMMGNVALTLACAMAGPLADRVFEPSMARGGLLEPTFGRILGVGPGRGVALLIVVLGGCTIAGVIAAFLHPRVRLVEEELPDAEGPGSGRGGHLGDRPNERKELSSCAES